MAKHRLKYESLDFVYKILFTLNNKYSNQEQTSVFMERASDTVLLSTDMDVL